MQINPLTLTAAAAGGPRERVFAALLAGFDAPEAGAPEAARPAPRAAPERRETPDDPAAAPAPDGVPSRPAEILHESERRFDVQSRGWHRAQNREAAADHARGTQSAFRRALADAATAGGKEAAGKPPVPRTDAQGARGVGSAAPAQPRADSHANQAGSAAAARPPQPQATLHNEPAGVRTSGAAAAPGQSTTTAVTAPAAQAPQSVEAQAVVPAKPPDSSSALQAAGRTAVPQAVTAPPPSPASTPAPKAEPVMAVESAQKAAPAARRGAGLRGPQASEPSTGKNDANIERIVRLVRANIGKDRSITTIRLDPPELGTVRLRMDLQKDALVLRVEPQSDAAHHLLSKHINSLRDGLESAGLRLERVDFRPPEATQQSAHHDAPADSGAHGTDGRGSAGAEHGSAGGGRDCGTDTLPPAPPEAAGAGATPGPATESLVNVLA